MGTSVYVLGKDDKRSSSAFRESGAPPLSSTGPSLGQGLDADNGGGGCGRESVIDTSILLPSQLGAVPKKTERGYALDNAVLTFSHATATRDLVQLYGLPHHASWEDVKKHRSACDYDELCQLCVSKAKVQCILIDDGLGGVEDIAEGYRWHD
jgi:hypothetical protein